jgi:hypothetical protein
MPFLLTLLQSPGPDHLLFRSEKSWALLAVMLIVFGGAVAMLLRQERKLRKLEKQLNDESTPHDQAETRRP